jgi:hypothetical protein
MTATFSPVYCTNKTDGSQRAMSKHNLSHPFKVLQAGIRTPPIWVSSADSITSKSLVQRYHLSPNNITSLALRVASLKHEDSSTRRLSQDLRSRKPATNPADQFFSRTPTLSNEDHLMQPRTLSQTQSRRTTDASAIPETPQRVVGSEADQGSPTDRTAATSAILEQPPPSNVSSPSQLDDDIQRRNSLDNMVGQRSPKACSGTNIQFS